MKKQDLITAIPDSPRILPAPGGTPPLISITTNRFPVWMNRHPIRWIISVAVIITLVTLLCLGWTAYTVQQGLIQSTGQRLIEATTDAADKLDMMILERYRDIQLLSTAPMVRGQNPEALTTYLRELVHLYPAYRWIGITDSRGRIIAATDPSSTSLDQSQHPWFRQARTLTTPKILNAQVSEKSGGALAITVIAPLHSPDGHFLGAIAAVVDVTSLTNILDDTIQRLRNSEWTEKSHIEYQVLNENSDLIAGSTPHEKGNLKELGLPSATLVNLYRQGFIEETHLHRGTSIITAYAQVTVAHADPAQRWGILIHAERNNILAPVRSFLWELSVLAILILLPLHGLVLGMIKTLHEEWNTTKGEFQRAADAETALTKRTEILHALVAAVQKLASQQDLDDLLHQLLHLAKENTGARYAALAVYDGNMRVSKQFLAAGVDDAAARAIQLLPFEKVSRESFEQGNGALHLTHLTTHWAALGLPEDDVPMKSFLGVPIRYHDQLFGHLSLANKVMPHGLANDFSDMDEQVVLTLAYQASTAIQNLQLLRDSKEQASHDSLTGLLNHSTTLTALTQELARAERDHQPLAVLIADLDHFKQINDTYGHLVGDVVLRDVATRLRETARRYDHVGRIGGEEFLIVVPNCDLEALRECAERFRLSISEQPFATPSGPLAITVSIGASVWSAEHPMNSDLLRKMADYALYRVKHHGRNGVDIITHPHHSLLIEQMKKTG
jgi:diguanylate cyclase (GGDEF)-like protein